MLVEHDITRDIDPPFFGIKALIAFVQVTISKEDALFWSKLEFLRIVGPKIRPNGTPKSTEKTIIRLATKQVLKGGSSLITLEGSRFIRNTEVENASSQNFRGKDE